MGYQEYTSGILGQTTSQTLVKSQGRISLLSEAGPSGMRYTVAIDYGEVTEERLFPTTVRKASDGSEHYTMDAQEAYAQFDALFAMYGGVTTDSSGIDPKKSGSFEELDEYLLALSELPTDIAVELQRRGIANTGKPKRTLNLQYETGLVSRILGPRKDSLKLARIHYESYAKETRMGALRDMRDRIASRYLTSELLSSILMSDRVKRDAYMTQVRAGYTPDISISNYMETQATVAAEPLIAFRVRFVDQTGREVSGMPYEASVRGVLNYKEALLKTNMGANPGAFSSGKMLTEQGMTGGAATDTTNGGQVENWRGRSLDPTYEYHLLYPYRARGKGGTPRGTVKVSITTPRNVNSTADWGNDRLKVYEEVANASEKRDANLTNPSPKMLLYSHNYKLEEGGDPERMVITVPIYIEPLPMHLSNTHQLFAISSAALYIPYVAKTPIAPVRY